MDVRLAMLALGWVAGWWSPWRVPTWRRAVDEHPSVPPSVGPETRSLPSITVVVPARNEAGVLPALLESLRDQTLPPHRVLVVDDDSDDGTADVARAYAHVTVVPGAALPPGWTGKAWACHQGAALVDTELVAFLDADVTLEPDALERLGRAHACLGGMVSVQPYHRMVRAYEQFSALFNVIGMMGIGAASPRRRGRSTGAFGPCLVTSVRDYRRVGGHASVRGDIADDLALAAEYRRAGLAVHTFGGGGDLSFRMYPGGLSQLVEGWSKNFATGAATTPVLRLFWIGLWVTATLVAVQSVIELLAGGFSPGPVVAAVVYVAFAAQLGVMLRQLGDFTWLTAALFPAAIGIFLVVFARSVYLTLFRRQVVWRGRAIPIHGERSGPRRPVRNPE